MDDAPGARTALSARSLVAAEVRAWAARRQYTQTRVAHVLGCSQAAVSRKYRGEVPFDVDELERLAAEWDLSIAAFFGSPAQADGSYRRTLRPPRAELLAA